MDLPVADRTAQLGYEYDSYATPPLRTARCLQRCSIRVSADRVHGGPHGEHTALRQ